MSFKERDGGLQAVRSSLFCSCRYFFLSSVCDFQVVSDNLALEKPEVSLSSALSLWRYLLGEWKLIQERVKSCPTVGVIAVLASVQGSQMLQKKIYF